jgi:hypothetical protein
MERECPARKKNHEAGETPALQVEDFAWPGLPRRSTGVRHPFSPFSGEKVAEGRMRASGV